MGGMGVGGGNGSVTSDLRSGGIVVERIEISGEEEDEMDALMGAASASATPMPAAAAAEGGRGGTGRNGTGRSRGRPRGGGRGGMSLSVPEGKDRLVMGAGVQSMDTGTRMRESSTKRDRVRSASSEEHDGGANSGFATPRLEEEEAGRRTPKRAVPLFCSASAEKGRKVLSIHQIHPPSVPMDGGRINYADLIDLPVYRQPRNGGLGGQRWQHSMDETRTIEAIMRQETTPREAREEVLSFLRDCSVEGDLDSLGLTELIYAMVVVR
uniref:Uncharacterized protein n=1 Tax=Chromera velia CCMP2878 TaxID=1169474 RepID=A0A0G4HRX3_9ALVE|eukprot:Cvel_8157.t1-p1 / transcript=Cvel_8157.t1 / gene=Cvel_8157 / organism=Chromera_velia_CCMP2878 / gene_product=hypothetical protein / transcript_product=hypothetical protein / location=Cvel_scaffold444:26425-27225(-) / protein_length=267 / sequence_SO=supercontig / SO=protein_coding / is_pseudo=false